jgi:hypothetical protein
MGTRRRTPPEPTVEYVVLSTLVDDRLIVDEHGNRLRIEPGARYTHNELLEFGWADEDIENLIECGALELAEEE